MVSDPEDAKKVYKTLAGPQASPKLDRTPV
jgi:hypothetical protein